MRPRSPNPLTARLLSMPGTVVPDGAFVSTTVAFIRPHLAYLFGLSLILFAGKVFANELEEVQEADSRIRSVMVYPGSAKVTREVTLAIPAGLSQVRIGGLPSNLNESSLRVSGQSTGQVRLGHVELSRQIQLDAVNEKERELKQQIEDKKNERQVVMDAQQRSQSQLEYIRAMVIGSVSSPVKQKKTDEGSGSSYSRLPLEQWQQAWDTLDQATAKAQQRIRQAQKTITDINKQIKKLEAELREVAVSRRQPATLAATLELESENADELTLLLSYQIQGASWSPIYDADLDTESGKLSLKTLARVSQRTGEDWRDVELALSTLRPGEGTQLPELSPWVIDYYREPEPVPYARSAEQQEMAGAQFDMAAPAPMMMTKKAKPARAMVAQESQLVMADFSAEYRVAGKVSLASGSDSRRFVLGAQQFDSVVTLAAVPRIDTRVMLLSTIKYDAEIPLLGGNVALYRDHNFVGNSYLNQKLAGEEIKLSFGEDDKVKITFQPDPDKKRKDGLLFGKRKVVQRHYQVSITSRHDKPYPLTLYEVIPFAADETIKVEMTGDKPDETDVDQKKGVIAWKRVIKPGEKVTLKYGYTVSYPEDKRIQGL